ncbi:SusC/RagA family TonB-linked outer membrane protein [Flavobacterium sp. HSC-61S13]|uniref:SusC/RagA family TonB-linked outer membrane protein n=1 Tax=Flavobacterium sp. HSC-61S13 TaxID=2910963 RepID=UPI00209FB625|nr:SusC/RagA family TonB-linked outer membrane protein [Flavobacterium sp. HSC-61S13]MCP1995021.1 TonB-linked SusC/RagA family outer membrane protein [Flavobacterium sp. HSC-61S13]
MRKIVLNFFLVLLTLLTVQEAYSQGRKVTGKVVSAADGLPLPGASVLIKGTQDGVSADLDGNYSITVKDGNAILVFGFMGYKSSEVKLQGRSVVNASLAELSEELGAIQIVTTGYEKVNKRTFTGAASRISEKELKVEGVPDVSRMIEGKAAGVNVQNVTGSFGAAPKITVRGSSSIMGDTKPLWVIDGVVQEDIVNVSFEDLASGNSETLLSSAIAGLNSSDVLSIEILKDASATSIYGSRAMNGVVVITTKSGRRETPLSVTYSMENTVRTVPTYAQFDILDSQGNMSILQELDKKGYLGMPSSTQGRYGGVYTKMYQAIDNNTLLNTQASKNKFLQPYEKANTDWFKLLFRPSITQNHSLSFSGGGKNNSYFASVGYYTDPGWTLADEVHRLTMNLKSTFYVNDKLTIALSSMASVRDQKAPGSYDSEKDVVNGGTSRNFDLNPFSYALNTSRTLRAYDQNGNLEYNRMNWAPFNILEELDNNMMNIDVKDIKFQIDAEYKILPKVTYNLSASARYADTRRTHDIYEQSNVVGAYNANETPIVTKANIFLYTDPNNPSATKVPVLTEGGIRRKFSNDLLSYNVRNSISYSQTFNDIHEVDVFAGTELRYVDRESNSSTDYGVMFDRGMILNTDPRILQKVINEGGTLASYFEERERTIGYFGKISYTYDRRYTVSGTGRYDGSNRQGLGGSNRWLPTWTASGKWNVSEEKFLQDSETISNLSFRGSYGLTATAGPATNSLAIYKSYITDRELQEDREVGLSIEDLQNADLTWEKQHEANIGMDLGLFHNRLQIVADVYQRKAFDLIDVVTTSGIGGQKTKLGNNADMTTKGVELSLTTRNIVGDQFSWSTTINASYYNQEITSLQNKPTAYELVSGFGGNVVGRPRNALYSYQFTGLTDQGLPTYIQADGETDNIAGAYFQDRQNITGYLKYEGAIEPNKSLGLSNTFNFNNWSLNIFVVASGGNKIRLNPSYSSSYGDLDVFTKDFENRWMVPGDEKITNIPVIADKMMQTNYTENALSVAYNTYNYSDQRVADGGFVRLKNISLGYEFPDHFKKNLGFSAFSLKLMATNPWLIYSDKKLRGQDPEFFRTGGVAMPITSQYTLTLNVAL